MAPAIADALNPPLFDLEQASFSNSCFVDDNGILALWSDIRLTLHNSIVAAFMLFWVAPRQPLEQLLCPGQMGEGCTL
jgi:hypothetical protein